MGELMAGQAYEERTNDQWVAALRGDQGPRAQAEAYQDLANYLFKVAYNHLRSRRNTVRGLSNMPNAQMAALAEDLMQSTLTKIWEKQLYNQFRGEGRFLAYMAVIAVNNTRQELRLKKHDVWKQQLPPSEPDDDTENGDYLPPLDPEFVDSYGPEIQQQVQEIWDTIERCVKQLPERWRQAFILNVLEDRPTTEVQKHVNASSEQAVYLLVHRARSRLKSCASDSGWNLDDVWRLLN